MYAIDSCAPVLYSCGLILPPDRVSELTIMIHPINVRTPPDFGILITESLLPYVRCISTLSFSWPTTRIVFTVNRDEKLEVSASKRPTGECIDTRFDEGVSVVIDRPRTWARSKR
jgi:hypothetical protein